jgi:hypothetical protein
MKRFVFLFVAAFLLVSASANASHYVTTYPVHYVSTASHYNGPVATYGVQGGYGPSYLRSPSWQTTFSDNKYAASYHSRVTNGFGQTNVQGYYIPKPYNWECAGNGCGRTQYLSGLRVQARHPGPGYAYDYSMQRTYW